MHHSRVSLLELMLAGMGAMDVIDCLCAKGIITNDASLDTDSFPNKKIILFMNHEIA